MKRTRPRNVKLSRFVFRRAALHFQNRLSMKTTFVLALALGVSGLQSVEANVVEYSIKTTWQSAVAGDFTTVTFTGFPDMTQITNQYAYLGITFSDPGGDFISMDDPNFPNNPLFPNDHWGLWGGHQDPIEITFSTPVNWIAVDFPGAVQFQLYNQSQLIYTSTPFTHGGPGWFAGLVSTQSFDFVRIADPTDSYVDIDDLYFGPPIPAPGGIALLALAGVVPRRRHRPS